MCLVIYLELHFSKIKCRVAILDERNAVQNNLWFRDGGRATNSVEAITCWGQNPYYAFPRRKWGFFCAKLCEKVDIFISLRCNLCSQCPSPFIS